MSVTSFMDNSEFWYFSDMINDSDLDGNKVLDFEEFLVMMEKKVQKVVAAAVDVTVFFVRMLLLLLLNEWLWHLKI